MLSCRDIDGSLVGGASFVAGRKANALQLNGTSGYARLPSGLLGNVQPGELLDVLLR